MSGATRSLALKHLQRAVTRWPKDPLRPDCQLQDALSKRLDSGVFGPKPSSLGGEDAKNLADLKQANALFGMLDNRFQTRHRISPALLRPASNPEYYANLLTEIEEAPRRSWLDRMAKRFGGMVRMA